jgi:hypothetical protein
LLDAASFPRVFIAFPSSCLLAPSDGVDATGALPSDTPSVLPHARACLQTHTPRTQSQRRTAMSRQARSAFAHARGQWFSLCCLLRVYLLFV